MRTPQINLVLERTLSRERLGKYLSTTGGDLNAALALYEWNTRLSESFYTPLQCLEVCLRNCLHQQMANVYGVDWFVSGNAPLANEGQGMIADAYRDLNLPCPIQPCDVVAAVRFAFWVSLLGPHYDATIWRRALYRAFQTGPGRPRSQVHGRLNMIRRFRNRVAHHEPIFPKNLRQVHDEIIETIGWMCADTAAWAKHHSRFPAVYAAP